MAAATPERHRCVECEATLPPNVPETPSWPCWSLALLLLGILASFITFGPMLTPIILYHLLEMIWFDPEWQRALCQYEDSLATVVGKPSNKNETSACGGTIISRQKSYPLHSLSLAYQYQVFIEYPYIDVANHPTHMIRKRYGSPSVASDQLYHWFSPNIAMHVVPEDRPQSGVPTFLLQRKLHDFRFVDRCLSLTVFALSLSVYILFTIGVKYLLSWVMAVSAKNNGDHHDDQRNVKASLIFWAIYFGASLAMAPPSYFIAKFEHKRRMAVLRDHDIGKVQSRADKIRQFWASLGHTWFVKTASLVFPFGCMATLVAGVLLGGALGIYAMMCMGLFFAKIDILVRFSNNLTSEVRRDLAVQGIVCFLASLGLLGGYFSWGYYMITAGDEKYDPANGSCGCRNWSLICLQMLCCLLTLPSFYLWSKREQRHLRPQRIDSDEAGESFHACDNESLAATERMTEAPSMVLELHEMTELSS